MVIGFIGQVIAKLDGDSRVVSMTIQHRSFCLPLSVFYCISFVIGFILS